MKLYPITQFVIVTIAVIVLSLLYFFYPATSVSIHPKCPFHTLTGLYCPGCGSQRAASALLHGKILHAIDLNFLFVFSVPLICYSAFVFSWNIFSEKKLQQKILHSPLFIKIFLAAVLMFWFLRNLNVRPFNWLAP